MRLSKRTRRPGILGLLLGFSIITATSGGASGALEDPNAPAPTDTTVEATSPDTMPATPSVITDVMSDPTPAPVYPEYTPIGDTNTILVGAGCNGGSFDDRSITVNCNGEDADTGFGFTIFDGGLDIYGSGYYMPPSLGVWFFNYDSSLGGNAYYDAAGNLVIEAYPPSINNPTWMSPKDFGYVPINNYPVDYTVTNVAGVETHTFVLALPDGTMVTATIFDAGSFVIGTINVVDANGSPIGDLKVIGHEQPPAEGSLSLPFDADAAAANPYPFTGSPMGV